MDDDKKPMEGGTYDEARMHYSLLNAQKREWAEADRKAKNEGAVGLLRSCSSTNVENMDCDDDPGGVEAAEMEAEQQEKEKKAKAKAKAGKKGKKKTPLEMDDVEDAEIKMEVEVLPKKRPKSDDTKGDAGDATGSGINEAKDIIMAGDASGTNTMPPPPVPARTPSLEMIPRSKRVSFGPQTQRDAGEAERKAKAEAKRKAKAEAELQRTSRLLGTTSGGMQQQGLAATASIYGMQQPYLHSNPPSTRTSPPSPTRAYAPSSVGMRSAATERSMNADVDEEKWKQKYGDNWKNAYPGFVWQWTNKRTGDGKWISTSTGLEWQPQKEWTAKRNDEVDRKTLNIRAPAKPCKGCEMTVTKFKEFCCKICEEKYVKNGSVRRATTSAASSSGMGAKGMGKGPAVKKPGEKCENHGKRCDRLVYNENWTEGWVNTILSDRAFDAASI